jgi:cobalt-zinc-cadmium efflux system outer membrane protein
VVQAGLLSNPSIGGHVEFATNGSSRDVQVSLVQDFLDLFVLPLRKRIAREQFEADMLRVAHQALETAAEVSKEVVATEAAARLVQFRQAVVDATLGTATLADKQLAAGNVNELQEASEQVVYAESVLDLARERTELLRHRERLNRLLGLWGPRADWTLAEELPAPPDKEPPLDHLETLAISRRLDVDAARKQRLLIAHAVGLARSSRLFGRIEVGVDVHQFPDGPRVFGPSLVLELPIFDQRQAIIARLEAQERQAERRLTAVSVTARSEVRLGQAEVLAARQMVDQYRQVVLPLRSRIVVQAQLHYNGMLIGLPQLLLFKQNEVEAQAGYIGALRDYWVARADLERAVGGRIPTNEKQP